MLGPLAFPGSMANTSVCGEISSLLESAWVQIFFSFPFFPVTFL